MSAPLSERISRYVAATPPAISGQGGHNQTFSLACALVNGFALSPVDAIPYLQQYNLRCLPPWSEKELTHKANSALVAVHEKPRGHLLNGSSNHLSHVPAPLARAPTPTKPPIPIPVLPEIESDLPSPQLNPAIAFLLAAFKPGDGVCIAKCVKHAKDDRDVPDGSGTVYPLEKLIELLQKQGGDPNPIFCSDRGAYIRVNPMSSNGDTDKDVTCFRHVLVEFDKGSPQEQWKTIIQSGAPITGVLTSGGKSLHAWVRIDASDDKDYITRRDKVYEYFQPLGADPVNKNASRFSRLPGMKRGTRFQELLAVNIGAPTFEQWLIDRAAAGIGHQISITSLLSFKAEQDTDCLLGNRWLCRGSSLVIVGQTHLGKSSLALQMAITWALNGSFLGIPQSRPIKSVFVQAENDLGDMAEIVQGILYGTGLLKPDQPENNKLVLDALAENLIIIRDQSHTGFEFVQAASKLIAKHHPDIFWSDPLLSFYGGDINDQKQASTFFRSWLNPISEATGTIWSFLHHTGKPLRDDDKATRNWKSTDYAYLGLGSSELSNWARAIICLIKVNEDEFKAIFAKRGWRANARDIDGSPTIEPYLAHGSERIYWKQIPKPLKTSSKESDAACVSFAKSLPSDFLPAKASAIVERATSSLKRGHRTVWSLWQKGSGPLGSCFVKCSEQGFYLLNPALSSKSPPLPYKD